MMSLTLIHTQHVVLPIPLSRHRRLLLLVALRVIIIPAIPRRRGSRMYLNLGINQTRIKTRILCMCPGVASCCLRATNHPIATGRHPKVRFQINPHLRAWCCRCQCLTRIPPLQPAADIHLGRRLMEQLVNLGIRKRYPILGRKLRLGGRQGRSGWRGGDAEVRARAQGWGGR